MRPESSEERERALLSEEPSSESLSESSRIYLKKIQEESLEGLPDYLRYVYICADYLGITSPEKRIAGKIKLSDRSCIKQRVLISQYEKKIKQQEQVVAEKESELGDCIVYFEKRKRGIEEAELKIESLEEERQQEEQKLKRNPEDSEAAENISQINARIVRAGQEMRRYEREKAELAARIIETEEFIGEAENVLVSVQVYSSALHSNYLRSRIERMRLLPLLGAGKGPAETIDMIVSDQRIAEGTGKLADAMTLWVGEITEQIAGMRISPRQRGSMYSEMRKKSFLSGQNLASAAEKVIEARRRPKYT